MKTLSYVKGIEEDIKTGKTYYFGQLWDGSGDGEELLKSRSISPDNENVVEFEVVETSEDVLDTVVKVVDIR